MVDSDAVPRNSVGKHRNVVSCRIVAPRGNKMDTLSDQFPLSDPGLRSEDFNMCTVCVDDCRPTCYESRIVCLCVRWPFVFASGTWPYSGPCIVKKLLSNSKIGDG